jgi:hypothetical protein
VLLPTAKPRRCSNGNSIVVEVGSDLVNTHWARDRGSIDVSQKALLGLQSYRVPIQFRRIGKILIGASRIFAFVHCQGQKKNNDAASGR